ncbi:hypothetical protein D3C72_1406020 [compost metagenome]
MQAFASVGLGFAFAAQHADDVVVIQRMAETVDRGGLVVGFADLGVIGLLVGELPFVDAVDGHAAHAHSALFAEDGDRAFQILRVGQHGDVDRPHGAMAPADRGDTGVFGFDAASQGGGVGVNAFHWANQPIEQVDIMAGLVHEGTTVPFPFAAPTSCVVIILGTGPENIHRYHVNTAEAAAIDGFLEQLQRGVAAVLLDDEQAHACFVASLDHALAIFPAGGHRLFADDVATGLRDFDGLPWMQAGRRRQNDGVGGRVGKHFRQGRKWPGAGGFRGGF